MGLRNTINGFDRYGLSACAGYCSIPRTAGWPH